MCAEYLSFPTSSLFFFTTSTMPLCVVKRKENLNDNHDVTIRLSHFHFKLLGWPWPPARAKEWTVLLSEWEGWHSQQAAELLRIQLFFSFTTLLREWLLDFLWRNKKRKTAPSRESINILTSYPCCDCDRLCHSAAVLSLCLQCSWNV